MGWEGHLQYCRGNSPTANGCPSEYLKLTDTSVKQNPVGKRDRTRPEKNHNIGIIAVGNAPTALLKVIDIFNSESDISNLKSRYCPDYFSGRCSRWLCQGIRIQGTAHIQGLSLYNKSEQERRQHCCSRDCKRIAENGRRGD